MGRWHIVHPVIICLTCTYVVLYFLIIIHAVIIRPFVYNYIPYLLPLACVLILEMQLSADEAHPLMLAWWRKWSRAALLLDKGIKSMLHHYANRPEARPQGVWASFGPPFAVSCSGRWCMVALQ